MFAATLAAPLLNLPLLLVLIPLAGCLIGTRYQYAMVPLAPLCSGLVLSLVIFTLAGFQPDSLTHGPIHIDAVGIPFITVTAILTFLLTLYQVVETGIYPRRTAALLGLEAVLMGLFTTPNLLVFTLLLTLQLITVGYLLPRRPEQPPAGRLYRQFMASGLLLLWVATLLLGLHQFQSRGSWSWELAQLQQNPLSASRQGLVFILMFYAAAIHLAQFPLHGWLPELGKKPVTPEFMVMMAGSKVGLYLLLRFVLPLLPDAVSHFRDFATGLGLLGICYGAVLAFTQIGLQRLLAFTLISQTGLLLVGVFSLNGRGLTGSLLLSFNAGLASAGLFLTAAALLRRSGTSLIPRIGRRFNASPRLAFTGVIAALSTTAIPGTPGFDAVHLLLEGILQAYGWGMAVAVASGNVLVAGLLLYVFRKIFLTRERATLPWVEQTQTRRAETVLNLLIGLSLLAAGFYQQPWMQWIDGSFSHLTAPYQQQPPP
jgi:NADH-quinone oxidoreductase subunit M